MTEETISKTARALEEYRQTVSHIEEDPMLAPEDVYADAYIVLYRAEIEGVSLEELVPDADERAQLKEDAQKHEVI